MRTKTTLAQRLPANMEDKIVTFHQFVVRARRRCEYPLSHIINMDETPMRFELPATRTLEFTGNRTVPITTCGADKQSFTVALAVKANGEKLPPKVIFKGVRQLRINLPPRMQVHKKRLDGWRRYLSLRLFISFVLWRIKLLSTCSRARIISMQIWLRSSGSLFTFDRRLIISALMFGFNCNSLKYFYLYLSFLGTKEWVQMPKQAL